MAENFHYFNTRTTFLEGKTILVVFTTFPVYNTNSAISYSNNITMSPRRALTLEP